jgi:hypothetical protein
LERSRTGLVKLGRESDWVERSNGEESQTGKRVRLGIKIKRGGKSDLKKGRRGEESETRR